MDAIKNDYKKYLATPSGKEDLMMAVKIKRDWMKQTRQTGCGSVTTDKVRVTNFPKELASKAKLLTIEPIGVNNCCHITSKWFKTYGYESQLGYNVTSCPCGKLTCMELHTINKKDGEFHDFTADFNEEKKKWFIPLPVTFTANLFTQIYGDSRDFLTVDEGCRCFSSYSYMCGEDEGSIKMTWKQVVDFFNQQTKIIVWN